MPGWDVKIRPGKDEEKKGDDSTWVIVVLVLLGILVWYLYVQGQGYRCGMYQSGFHCDRGSVLSGGPVHSSGHHRPHRQAAPTSTGAPP